MDTLVVEILSRNALDEKNIKEIAKLFAEIWKEPPWNEDCWDELTTTRKITDDLSNPHAIAVIVKDSDRIIGFTWGYIVDRKKIRIISGNNHLDFLFRNEQQVFYLSELGIARDYRHKQIGEIISRKLLESVEMIDDKLPVLLRTDVAAFAAIKLYQKLGFKEVEVYDTLHTSRKYWLR